MTESKIVITRQSSERAYPAGCEFGLEVSRQFSVFNDPQSSQGAWRLKVEILAGYEIDPNVFLYQRRVDPSQGVDRQDVFVGVCSPVDLEDYPTGTPDDDDDTGFFRMADIDVLTRNRDKLDRLWELILEDLTELVTTMVNICELEDPAVFDIGTVSSSSSPASRAVSRQPLVPYTPATPRVPSGALNMPQAIVITVSDDSVLPVGEVFHNVGGSSQPVVLNWTAATAAGFELRVYPETHRVELVHNQEVLGGAGIAHTYRAIINYKYQAVSHNLHIEGVW